MLADDRARRLPGHRRLRVQSTSVPRLSRGSSFIGRLDAGNTVALDDPIAAARFSAEEVEFWRDQGIYYFVPCIFEGVAIAVLALSRKENDEPFNSEDLALLTAVAGQVATAIENGTAVSPAASQGRRTRADARVQRQHPRVAGRRAGGLRRRRAHRPLEPCARNLLRSAPRRGHRAIACRDLRGALRRGARRRAPRPSGRRDAVQGAA